MGPITGWRIDISFIFVKGDLGEDEVCVLGREARKQIGESFSDHNKLLRIIKRDKVCLYDWFDEKKKDTVFETLLYRTFNGNVLIEKILDGFVRDGFIFIQIQHFLIRKGIFFLHKLPFKLNKNWCKLFLITVKGIYKEIYFASDVGYC